MKTKSEINFTEEPKSKLEEVFKSNMDGGGAFIPFVVAGDPDIKGCIEVVKRLIDSGADIVELGIPYSDPAADGPSIQKGYKRALENSFRVKNVFEIIREIRKFSDIPIVLMSYYNLVYQYGIKDFYKDVELYGANGVIIPDMPPEESNEVVLEAEKRGVGQIFLVSENTPKNRIKRIRNRCSGFIYVVSRLGVTGARDELPNSAKRLIKKIKFDCGNTIKCEPKSSVKDNFDLPVCVGFGISKKNHIKSALKAGADGVICGSVIVDMLDRGNLEQISRFTDRMSKSTEIEC